MRRVHKALALKAGLFIGADRAAVVGIRVGHDARRSRFQQSTDELADEARAMAAPDHSGLPDELVDAAGLGRMRAQALVPGAQRVALDVAERMAAKADMN